MPQAARLLDKAPWLLDKAQTSKYVTVQMALAYALTMA